jgi:hypothetical protein
MLGRVYTLAVLTGMTLTLPLPRRGAHFSLDSTGAIRLKATGREARYGFIGKEVNGSPMLSLSLGANSDDGSLLLSLSGDREPATGRYPVLATYGLDDGQGFHASFVAGSVGRPRGYFRAESGWVQISDVGEGRMAGEFEIQARGFTREQPDNENQWVRVKGRFDAREEGVGVASR